METFDYKKYTWIAGILSLVCIAFVAFATGLSEMKSLKHPNGTQATITVTGEGEVTAIPDIATVTMTVREVAKTVPLAQKAVETKITKALADISSLGVDKKDTKTLSYTVNPKYETQNTYCPMVQSNSLIPYPPCPQGKSVIVGYEVAETVSIKIRKIDTAGDVVGVIGKANITEVNGPDFTVDNIDKPKADAKVLAIQKAQDKAKATAKALGVSLGEITQFSEDNGGYYPMMYSAGVSAMKAGPSDSVTIPTGESVIKSNVTITYSLD